METILDAVQPHLGTRRLGKAGEHHEVIDSTNRRAMVWAEAGSPYGALVIAEHQTHGRGRLGRNWSDQPGTNLLFSVILRPPVGLARLGLLSLAAGVAVTNVLGSLTEPVVPALKWPNDVILDGAKVCGILPEARHDGDRITVVLGVGLNVNQTTFPHEIEDAATSVALVVGRLVDRAQLLANLLQEIEIWTDRLFAGDAALVIEAFSARMIGLGDVVSVRLPDGAGEQGRAAGIGDDGSLILETSAGIRYFSAGEVSLRPEIA